MRERDIDDRAVEDFQNGSEHHGEGNDPFLEIAEPADFRRRVRGLLRSRTHRRSVMKPNASSPAMQSGLFSLRLTLRPNSTALSVGTRLATVSASRSADR